ncbi:outer membrane protein [Pedobacter sp. CAN_A7]|uniref:TolC family protein n=1 Tax=Pedobacter sp. CAN_A7 TaxID=2787722 RepID=UPI0018C95B3A
MKKLTNNRFLPNLTRLCFLGLFVAGFSTDSVAQETITLPQAIDRMLQNNLNIKQGALSVATSDVNLRQSRAALLPNLNATNSNNLSFGRGLDQTSFQIVNQKLYQGSGSVGTSIDLFGGFAKINQIKQNKILLEADQSNVEKIKNDLTLDVVVAYMQVVYNEDLLKASRQQLAVSEQTMKREDALMEVGNKTMADISQARAQVSTAELNVTNAQNDLSISYLTLAQLMEMGTDSATFKVVAPTVSEIAVAQTDYEVNEVYNQALDNFPDIKLANLNTLAAEKGIAIAKGSLYPSISLNAGLGSSYSYIFKTLAPQDDFSTQIDDRFNQYIGLSLQIPIFNGLSAKSNVKRAKITYQNYKIQEQLAKNNLNKVIAQAVMDLKAAESRYRSTQNTFNAQRDAFNVNEQRYNVGLVNSLDYNTAITNRNQAEIDFIQAKYDLVFRSKVIDYYLGKQITF